MKRVISFEVMAFIQRKAAGFTYIETELREYCTDTRLVLRGKPKWQIGDKVDFVEMPPLKQRKAKQ